jgi:hypothetical protein
MHESWPYRKKLAKFSSSFEARAVHQIWREDSLAEAEWMFFVGFFVVRKLIENRKVTDAVSRMNVRVEQAAINRSHVVSSFSRHDLEKDLDSAKWSVRKIDVAQLADKVIHAWWTAVLVGESKGHGGYIFTTDRDKDASLLKISATDIAAVFRSFASGEINSLVMERDPTGKLIYWKAE